MTNPTPPAGPAAKGKGGWFAKHKWWVVGGGGAVAVAGVALYERNKSSSSSGSAGSTTDATDTTPTGSVAPVTYTGGGGGGDDYDSLDSQVAALQSQLAATSTVAQNAAKNAETGRAIDRSQGTALKKLTGHTAKSKAPAPKPKKKPTPKKK